ncbi:Imm1 family immunity protein [Kitasatospora sp. NPDC097643]|uniref:Imm1 family immunity protein n=1 Tax=Kitasatospora sp. NPDC097643 TaxID=3157230 RepID=UPI0033190C52
MSNTEAPREMVLSVAIGDDISYPQSHGEIDAAIEQLVSAPYWRQPVRFAYSFGPAESFSDVCSFVLASVDTDTGYGGLIWSVTGRYPTHEWPFDNMWVSDNKMPPEVDPQVLSDPHTPAFFDRCSALPIAQLKDALREFCRSGNGTRPTSIDWVVALSDNGMRLDREPEEQP